MALTPLTLPEATPYPASTQALLELFAAYLTAPTAPKAIYVQTTAPTGIPEGAAWFNPETKEFKIWATVAPATAPAWTAWLLPDASVLTAKIADGAVTRAKLEGSVLAIIDALANVDSSTVVRLQENTGGGSERANFFITADGALRCTGFNGTDGKNGFGRKATGDASSLPKRCGFSPPLGASRVAKVYVSPSATFVLTDDGKVYAAGINSEGQLGLGDTVIRYVFTQIAQSLFENSAVTKLALGAGSGSFVSVLALGANGKVYAWGHNIKGQLGIGSNLNASAPVLVSSLVGLLKADGVTPNLITDIAMGNSGVSNASAKVTSYALTTEGTVFATGYGNYGQLGHGANTDRNSFLLIPNLADLTLTPDLTVVEMAVASGNDLYCTAGFRMSDGSVRTMGSGTYGQCGNNAILNANVTQTVVTDGVGTVLGTGTASLVTKLHAFGAAFVALCDNGSVWGWGFNLDGAFGDGGIVSKSVATQIPVSTVAAVSMGGNHLNLSIVLRKTDGTLWAAGHNNYGQLGLGHITTPVSTFAQVLLDSTDVAEVVFGSNWNSGAGFSALLIRLTNGPALACGYDAAGVGQLGIDASPLPVSVPSYVNF